MRDIRGETSRRQFGEALDMSDASVQKYEEGKAVPSVEAAAKIAELGGVGVDWLLGLTSSVKSEDQNVIAIPHYDIEAHAGSGSMEMVADISKYMSFDTAWFDKYVPPAAILGALDINGDSMQPTLNPGDMIIVNMNRESIKDALAEGGIFVLAVRGDFKVKRLQPMINGSLRMISDNPRYQEEVIPSDILESDVYIQGHVIWIGGPPK